MSRPIPEPQVWPPVGEEWVTRWLWAALVLAPTIEVFEAVVYGVPVPSCRLDPTWTRTLRLDGDVILDGALVLQINAHGPRGDEQLGREDHPRARVLRLGDAGGKQP